VYNSTPNRRREKTNERERERERKYHVLKRGATIERIANVETTGKHNQPLSVEDGRMG
jgi:hypothetical protein